MPGGAWAILVGVEYVSRVPRPPLDGVLACNQADAAIVRTIIEMVQRTRLEQTDGMDIGEIANGRVYPTGQASGDVSPGARVPAAAAARRRAVACRSGP